MQAQVISLVGWQKLVKFFFVLHSGGHKDRLRLYILKLQTYCMCSAELESGNSKASHTLTHALTPLRYVLTWTCKLLALSQLKSGMEFACPAKGCIYACVYDSGTAPSC